MLRSSPSRLLGLAVAGSVLAACTAAATPTPTSAPTSGASTPGASAAGSPAATAEPGTKNFNVVFTSPGLSSAPMLAAIDNLRSQGYTIDVSIIESSELVVQGVAQGQFAFGSGANNAVLSAIEKGGPTMLGLMARIANEWTVYARTATIKTCADLGGKRLAIHSEGGSGGNAALLRGAHDDRAEPAQLLLEQADGVVQLVTAEGVAADQLGEPVGLVDRRRPNGPHLEERHRHAARRGLPCGFDARETAANYGNHDVRRATRCVRRALCS